MDSHSACEKSPLLAHAYGQSESHRQRGHSRDDIHRNGGYNSTGRNGKLDREQLNELVSTADAEERPGSARSERFTDDLPYPNDYPDAHRISTDGLCQNDCQNKYTDAADDLYQNNYQQKYTDSTDGLQRTAPLPHHSVTNPETDILEGRTTHSAETPLSKTPKQSKDGGTESNPGSQNCRLALIVALTFLMSCAGKFHSPLMTQYIYQMYTESIYGNASLGVQVSKQPCVNNSAANSTEDPLRDEVQEKSADLYMWLDLVAGGIAVLTNLCLGAYSDVLGRKFVLLLPIVGHFLRNASAPVIIYWDLGLYALYSGYVLDGLCGGSAGIMLGFYVYASDITRGDKQRTLGMALVEAAIGLADAATEFAAGLIIQDTGFLWASLLASGLLLICIIFILWLPETVPRNVKQMISPMESVRRTCKVFMTRDQPYQATLLLLGLLAFFLAEFPAVAISKLKSLILMNEPFCWDALNIGILGSVETGGSHVMSLVLIKVMQRFLTTPVLAIIGATSHTAGRIMMGLATTSLVIYIRAGILIPSSMVIPSIRSLMSRMVPPDKQGAMFAGLAVVESLCTCLSQLTFLSIYKATLTLSKGIVYFIMAGLYVGVIVICLFYLRILGKKMAVQNRTISIQAED